MTDIAQTKTFQERMFERVREQIGELMTDEELAKIVERSVEKLFFEPVKVSSGYREEYQPPAFQKMIRELCEPRVRQAVKDWVEAHPEEITKALDEVLAKGVYGMIKQHFEYNTQGPLVALVETLKSKGLL